MTSPYPETHLTAPSGGDHAAPEHTFLFHRKPTQLGLTLATTPTSDTTEHPKETNVHVYQKMQKREFIATSFTDEAGDTT